LPRPFLSLADQKSKVGPNLQMIESYERANGELRRADHLMYVSLKYTRTVDVLKSLVERLINTYDFLILVLLKKANVRDPPRIPRLRVELLRKHYADDDMVCQQMELYLLMREIVMAPFDRKREYRRHVTMISHLDDKEIEVTIDIADDYFKKVKEFVEYCGSLIKE